MRRPDRVILKMENTIIDFKFGEENPHYLEQIDQYRNLLIKWDITILRAYLWYVDKIKLSPLR